MVAAFCAAVLTGCQSYTVTPSGAEVKQRSKSAPTTQPDACAANLHELCGVLLQYYLVHRDLPARLEDVATMADALQPVSTHCTVSGKPYIYERAGLVAPNETRRVVVLDPDSTHAGGRWAVVTVPPEGKTPLGLWVVKLSETVAQQYHREVTP